MLLVFHKDKHFFVWINTCVLIFVQIHRCSNFICLVIRIPKWATCRKIHRLKIFVTGSNAKRRFKIRNVDALRKIANLLFNNACQEINYDDMSGILREPCRIYS